ncbi:MAG: hypothetical protein RDV48_12765, partial [Candidatus Eremiobacteraeota bacterium]|nr:hypothetical protein [Candidatus Eremiobacteraeota bacterium]
VGAWSKADRLHFIVQGSPYPCHWSGEGGGGAIWQRAMFQFCQQSPGEHFKAGREVLLFRELKEFMKNHGRVFFCLVIAALTCLLASFPMPAEGKESEKRGLSKVIGELKNDSDRVKCTVKHHNIYASNGISGPGAELATSFDMTIYEAGLYRRFELQNDTLLTRNFGFPIAGGSAFTSNTWLSFDARCTQSLTGGASVRLYTMADTDNGSSVPGTPMNRLARSYGVMAPNTAFTSAVPGIPGIPSIPIPGFFANLSRLYLEGKGERSRWTVEAGELYPTMGKPYNKYLAMDQFLFRTPISQLSVLGHWKKQDALFSEAIPLDRMPGYGLKWSGEAGAFNYEVFSLKNFEMPTTLNREYDYHGVRAGYAKGKVRGAASFITSRRNMLRPEGPPAIPSSSQESLLGAEGEYDISPSFGLYGALTSSRYHEDGARAGIVFPGSATLLGLRGKFLNDRLTADLRYQYLDPDYEPLVHTKKAVYPSNYEGMRYELKYNWADNPKDLKKGKNMVALHVASLSQIDGNINISSQDGYDHFAVNDYIFPAGGTKWVNNSVKGTVNIFAPEFCFKFRRFPFKTTEIEFGGYYENLRLQRGTDALGRSYDKTVDNLSLWMDIEFIKHVEFVLGMREVTTSGHWFQNDLNYRFSQKCTIPKAGIVFDNDDTLKFSAHMHFFNFADSSPSNYGGAFSSTNDWKGSLFLLESSYNF